MDVTQTQHATAAAIDARQQLQAAGIHSIEQWSWCLFDALGQQLGPAGGQIADDVRELIHLGVQAGWIADADAQFWRAALASGQYPPGQMASGASLAHEYDALLHCWRARALVAPVVAPPLQLSGNNDEATALAAYMAEVWDIQHRDDLIATLLWLSAQGQRYAADLDVVRLQSLDAAGRDDWQHQLKTRVADMPNASAAEQGQEIAYGQQLRQWVEQGEPLEWAAWDWVRLIDLAYQGVRLGWLAWQEACHFSVHAHMLLAQRYTDWQVLAAAWLRGRQLFEGSANANRQRPLIEHFLNNAWGPWQQPLKPAIQDHRVAAADAFIRSLRGGPEAFVMALAAVREPQLVYRCYHAHQALSGPSEEAVDYLDNVIEWGADEGEEVLRRFWQPALVHCLNQQAFDAERKVVPVAFAGVGKVGRQDLESRQQLADAQGLSATIYMAEKYAFHLVMGWDAGKLDSSRFRQLAAGVRRILCQCYRHHALMLKAWQTWERCLPSEDEEALEAELEWQRRDPGALLHWLEHVTAEDVAEPGPRPGLAEFTGMALAGPINHPVWSLPETVAPSARREITEWLEQQYSLASASELEALCKHLLEAGDSMDYQINYAPYTMNAQRLTEEIAILESGVRSENEQVHLERLRRVRDNSAGINDRDIKAWDIAQLVDIAIAGRQLGWLEEHQLTALLAQASEVASQHYADWAAYAAGLRAGFAFYMMEEAVQQGVLDEFDQQLVAWLSGAPPLAGCWAALDFPGAAQKRWQPLLIDMLLADNNQLH